MAKWHSENTTDEPWKVGLLFSQSGFMALIEETQFRGTMVAIDEINNQGGINGREIQPLVYDPSSQNTLFRDQAHRMLTQDGISTIFGCYTSSSRKSVLPVIERLNGLLWYPTLYEGFEYSPNVIYTGAAPNQNSVALVDFLLENYGNRFYFVGSDYIYAHESNKIMSKLLNERQGQVVGKSYVPLTAKRQDFFPIMRDIKLKQPDVIFSTVVGSPTVYLYQSYNDFSIDPKVTPIASLTTTETEVFAMGSDVGENHITAASYFQCIDNAVNENFINRYKKLYGENQPTNMCAEAAYFQVHLFAKALEMTNSLDPELLKPMALGQAYDAPQGRISINPSCAHTDLWSRIGKVNQCGQFQIVKESKEIVQADPFFIGNYETAIL